MASIRARRPDSSASCSEQLERLVGDAVLRVIEEDARGLGRHPLAALGIIGEQSSQVQAPHVHIVIFEGPPCRVFARRSCENVSDRAGISDILSDSFMASFETSPVFRRAASPPTAEIRRERRWRYRLRDNVAAALRAS